MLRAWAQQHASKALWSEGVAFAFASKTLLRHALSTLVIAEHKAGKLAAATRHVLAAAQKLPDNDVSVLVAGENVGDVAKHASILHGVSKVLVADDACLASQLAEPIAALVASLQQRRGWSHVMAPSSTFGKNILPRAAALLNVQPIADVIDVIDDVTFVRPIYAGNALATLRRTAATSPTIVSVRSTAFAAVDEQSAAAAIEAVSDGDMAAARKAAPASQWIAEDVRMSERPELGGAKVIVSGGRALASKDNFKLVEDLADALGGAIGASRAAVDAGYVANDLQVGQTGKVVAADLYIAVGISGAIQHLAGMKDCKTIVAINTDPEAPIFQVADYGLQMDLFKALPELTKLVKQQSS